MRKGVIPPSEAVTPRLRLILLVPFAWAVFAVILPDFVMHVLEVNIPLIHVVTDIVLVILMGGVTLYLIYQLRWEKNLTRLMLPGLLCLFISQSFRISRTVELFNDIPVQNWDNLSRAFDNVFNGLGLVLIATAFFLLIVDLLATRKHIGAEHERLLHEIGVRRESEAKYRELVENANSIILRMDVEGRVTFFNEFAQRFFGYSEEEILGKSVVGTIVPETSESGDDLATLLGEVCHHPELHLNNENENVRRNGERVWIAWTNKPMLELDGRLKGVLCVGNDITERVHAQQVIMEQQTRMISTAKLLALGAMTGNIAHEINNPLAIVSVAAEQLETLLASEHPDQGQLHKLAEVIARGVERMHRIIRGLRMLSRDGASDPFSSVAVKDLIADTLELCQARFAAHETKLTMSDIPSDLEIACQPTQLSQVILNLLNNALDAVESRPEKWVYLEVLDLGNAVTLSVTDSGSGIPARLREQIMIPFFTTKEPGKGIGLGLSISARIAQAHGGELLLDDASPHTRFVLHLPKQHPRGSLAHERAEAVSSIPSGLDTPDKQ